MVDSKKIKLEVDGLSDIRQEVVETAKALKRLEDLYKEATKRGGQVSERARHLFEQQRLQIKQKALGLVDIRERIEAETAGPERERLGRRLQRETIGVQRIAAKAETVAGQAQLGRGGRLGQFGGQLARTALGGTAVGQIAGAFQAGGPVIGAAVAAGMALKKLAGTAKEASDMFVKHMTSELAFARGLTGNQRVVERIMDFDRGIGGQMRRFGFARPQTLQMAQTITGAGGMTGRTRGEQFGNLAEDITGAARIAKFLGLRGERAAGLIGQARGAGIEGGGLGEFLGGLGERARAGAPALRGRVGEFLSQAVDYLKTISTTLDKSEKRDAVNFFTRVMGGLAQKGAEFTGAGMRQMLASVDNVLQSGQGIIGGTFGRFLTSKIAGEQGRSQIDVLKELDKGIMADGGKVFQTMLKEMTASTGSLDNVAVILAGETKRKFTETKAFLEVVQGLDLTTGGGLAEFKKRAAAFDPQMEADKLEAARAKQTDAMLRFGEAVPIFRAASLLLGDVAGLMLRDDREEFMRKFVGEHGFVDKISQKKLEAITSRFAVGGGGEAQLFGGFQGKMAMQLSQKLRDIFAGEEGEFTPTGDLTLGFSKAQTKRLATQMGFATSEDMTKSADFQLFVEALKEFISERTLAQPQKITVTFMDKEGVLVGSQDVTTDRKD